MGGRSIATRTTWESVPCSAWDRRSDATNIGFAVLSAITCDPSGSFSIQNGKAFKQRRWWECGKERHVPRLPMDQRACR